jgi:hypothetical protein
VTSPSLPRYLRFILGDALGMVLRSHLALEVALNIVDARGPLHDGWIVGHRQRYA